MASTPDEVELIISLLCNVVSSLNLDCFELRFIISFLITVVDTSVSSTKYKKCNRSDKPRIIGKPFNKQNLPLGGH